MGECFGGLCNDKRRRVCETKPIWRKFQVSSRTGQGSISPTSNFTLQTPLKRLAASLQTRPIVRNKANSWTGGPGGPGASCETKPICREQPAGKRKPRGGLRQTKPNLGRMGYLGKHLRGVRDGCMTEPAVRNKANLRRKTKPRRPRHTRTACCAKQSQLAGLFGLSRIEVSRQCGGSGGGGCRPVWGRGRFLRVISVNPDNFIVDRSDCR